MPRSILLHLSFWTGLLRSPLAAHAQAQTPPQFVNASGVACCNSPPSHNYGETIPTPNTVTVSGYSL